MQHLFRNSFVRDIKKIKDKQLYQAIQQVIDQVQQADVLTDIPHLKKMSGSQHCYAIRLHEYRIGIYWSPEEADEVEFVRCLHRREIYRFFP
ncbi:type II toxin-antitoxin system RelE family toxin [Pelovirga terrestris]|uniref:Type II toxin-antitoxin system RelE/ParE family toxin n=1 Tax=Pelovirga terrestris TaxID=2771352 RepID=A0A8J6QYL2_9BACT|nr:type II toxin-antitoxin system RelE/ParE family toxin [Pelovirga terrestris]MBD1401901.1 type II toxin-antitoxin system RelE/ParE family toxin [Pelovirga terrestris]